MRGKKQIVIDIDQEGNCSIDGQGFIGPECGAFIGEIENSLGKQISQVNKSEYKQRQTTKNRNYQFGGR